MVNFSMFFVYLLKYPIIWMGADFEQVKQILETKLSLDFRRGPSVYQSAGKSKYSFGKQLFFFMMMGLLVALGFVRITNLMLIYTIVFSVIMVLTSTTLISEFTSVLFDHRDNLILLVRPISNRTLLLSRLLHIQFYVMYIAVALSLFSVIASVICFGVFTAFLFLVSVVISTWVTLLITTLFYLLISKFVNGEKFKDIITFVQIVLAIIVMGGYQVLSRINELSVLQNTSMEIHIWTYIVPPAWLAAIVQLSLPNLITIPVLVLAIMGFGFSIVGGILTVRFLSSGFGDIITQSAEESAEPQKVITTDKVKPTGIYRFLCVSEYEKAGWQLVMAITRRDRKFKQAVYPSFGAMLIVAFAVLHPDFNDLSGWFQHLGSTRYYLSFIFFGFFATTSIVQIQFTDTPEAAWIYRALPIATPGHILTGAIKAMLIKFFVPMYTILSLVVLYIWGLKMIPLMLLGAVMTVTSTLVTLDLQNKSLPFSQAREMQQKGTNTLKVFLGLFIMGIIAGIVFAATFVPSWIVIICGALVLYFNTFVFKDIRKTTFSYAD